MIAFIANFQEDVTVK